MQELNPGSLFISNIPYASLGVNGVDGRTGFCHSWDLIINPVNSANTPPQYTIQGGDPGNLHTH